jgi:hypothetical protein
MPRVKIDDENDDVGETVFRSIIGRLIVETIDVLRRGVRLFIGVFFIMTKIYTYTYYKYEYLLKKYGDYHLRLFLLFL